MANWLESFKDRVRCRSLLTPPIHPLKPTRHATQARLSFRDADLSPYAWNQARA